MFHLEISVHVHRPYSNKRFRGKSWGCHPARNDLTSTNVGNISLCLPAYRLRGRWMTQVNTAEYIVTPPSSSCFDYSSYLHSRYHSCLHISWVHTAPYIIHSVWPLTEWFYPCFQSPLLWETFQWNTFPAGRFTSSSCQNNSSPYLDRVLALDCFLGDHASLTKKPYFRGWSSWYINLCFSETENWLDRHKVNTPNTVEKNLNGGILTAFVDASTQKLAWETHCLEKHTSTSFSK